MSFKSFDAEQQKWNLVRRHLRKVARSWKYGEPGSAGFLAFFHVVDVLGTIRGQALNPREQATNQGNTVEQRAAWQVACDKLRHLSEQRAKESAAKRKNARSVE